MTSLNQASDNLEWVDDVADYQCTRCHKVLVKHYIANCLHKFCSNCKRILDDGSHGWRCPNCQQFIVDMDGQDLEFKARVNNLRLLCPNRMYGCQHVCRFRHLKVHLDGCENTKEQALPVFYDGAHTTGMLERIFTMQMSDVRREMAEMKRTILRLKNTNKDASNTRESVWDLSVEVNELRRGMLQMEKKKKAAKNKVSYVKNKITGVKSDLIVETTQLKNDIQELRKNQALNSSLDVAENKIKILKLEGKAESYFEMIEFNNRKNNELMQRLRMDLEKQLQTLEIKIRENESQNANAENVKLKRVVANEKKNSEEIAKLSEQIESLNRDLLNNQSEFIGEVEKCLAGLKKVEKENDKIGKTLEESQAEVEEVNADTKNILRELNKKVVKMKEDFQCADATINIKLHEEMERAKKEMERSISHLTTEMEKLNTKFIQIPPSLSTSKSKSDEEEAKPPPSVPFLITNIPQMACFELGTSNNKFILDLAWKIDGIINKLLRRSLICSQWFVWNGYPIKAQAEIQHRCRGPSLWLRLDPQTPLNSLKIIPTIYFVLKDRRGNVKHKTQSKSYLFGRNLNDSIEFDYDIHPLIVRETTFKNDLETELYNVRDSVLIEIYTEPAEITQQVYSYDGILNWAIDQYSKRKKLAEEELVLYQESPYFYTSPKGYRVQVLMFLDGYVEDEYGLHAKIMFLRGEFDENLPKTFLHSTTVTLLDQKDPDGNVSVKVECDLRARQEYFISLGTDKRIKALIENDTVYYNVTIKEPT